MYSVQGILDTIRLTLRGDSTQPSAGALWRRSKELGHDDLSSEMALAPVACIHSCRPRAKRCDNWWCVRVIHIQVEDNISIVTGEFCS